MDLNKMPKYWKISPEITTQKTSAICDNFKNFTIEKQKRVRKKSFYLTTITEDELISEQQRKYYFKVIIEKFFVPYFQGFVDKPVDKITAHYTVKYSEKLNLWDSAWDKIEQGLDGNKNIIRSITNLTTKQMATFIERLIEFAASKGYHIPEPCEADYDEYCIDGMSN